MPNANPARIKCVNAASTLHTAYVRMPMVRSSAISARYYTRDLQASHSNRLRNCRHLTVTLCQARTCGNLTVALRQARTYRPAGPLSHRHRTHGFTSAISSTSRGRRGSCPASGIVSPNLAHVPMMVTFGDLVAPIIVSNSESDEDSIQPRTCYRLVHPGNAMQNDSRSIHR